MGPTYTEIHSLNKDGNTNWVLLCVTKYTRGARASAHCESGMNSTGTGRPR